MVTPTTIRGFGRRRMGGRAAAAVIDEGISSLQNFVVIFPALHFFSVSGIGRFTVAYTIALLAEAILKSLLLEPLTIRFSAARPAAQRTAGASAVGASLTTGLVLAGAAALLSLMLSGESSYLVLVTGLAVPALIVQETWRVYFFTTAQPWSAALNDTLCLFTTVALVVTLGGHAESVRPPILLVLWAAGTSVGAVAGSMQTRIVPAVGAAWGWLRTHSDLGFRLAGASAVTQAAGRTALILVSAIGGSAALGQFSASRTLVSPMTTLTTSGITFAVPEAARLHARRDPRVGRLTRALSGALVLAFGLFGLVAFALPPSIGHVIAGENWDTARSLLVPVIIAGAAGAAIQGPRVGLRVFEQPGVILHLSATTGATLICGTAVGTASAGAFGAAWGFAAAQVACGGLWWLVYTRLERQQLNDAVDPAGRGQA